MREKELEHKFSLMVKKNGGLALKFVSPGMSGMPDRIALFPKGHLAFVEVKAPGEVPRPLQYARHRMLQDLGFSVFILDRQEQIGGIINEIRAS